MSLLDADRELPLLPEVRKYQLSSSFNYTISGKSDTICPVSQNPLSEHDYLADVKEYHPLLTLLVVYGSRMFGQAGEVSVCFGVDSPADDHFQPLFVDHTVAHRLFVQMNHLFELPYATGFVI